MPTARTFDFDQDFVIPAHSGVLEDPYWKTLLDNVRAATDADYVSFAFGRPGAPMSAVKVMHSAQNETQPEMDPQDLEAMQRRYPLPHHALAAGRVYALDEILDPGNDVHNAFRAYMSARSLNFNRVLRVTEPSGSSGWLGISRRDGDFAADARDLLERLAPHLAIAVRSLAAIEQERLRSTIAADAVRRLNFGWLTLDTEGRVVEVAPEAEDILRSALGGAAIEPGKRLDLPDRARGALKKALADFAGAEAAKPRAIHILDEPWLDMLIVHTAYHTVSGGRIPIATAYVHGGSTLSADRCQHLMDLFSLSYNEAQVALALSLGKTLAEAAAELGIAAETARFYSKRVYAKTGTRGQADLVRFILASVIALA